MAQFHSSGLDGYEAVHYAQPHANTLVYMQNMLEENKQYATPQNQMFFEKAFDRYEEYYGSDTLRRMRALNNVVDSGWQDQNRVRALTTIEQLQTAPNAMQRWLMAEPTIRKLYHTDRVDGFRGSYVDPEPGKRGQDQYDYRRVMNGIVNDREDGSLWSTEWVEDLLDGDVDLLAEDQFDILRSWEVLALKAMGEEDPVSVWSGDIG